MHSHGTRHQCGRTLAPKTNSREGIAPVTEGPAVGRLLLAAHDDGGGAVHALLTIARAILAVVGGMFPVEIALWNSSRAADSGLHKRFGGDGRLKFEHVAVDHLIRLPKNSRLGQVDAHRIPRALAQAVSRMGDWPFTDPTGRRRADDIAGFDLVIGMGVPWGHPLARAASVHSIEVGDMVWSRVLRGCLSEAGLMTPAADVALSAIAKAELQAASAWWFRYMAPDEYEDHFRAAGIPVRWLDGALGDSPADAVLPDGRKLPVGLREVAGRDLEGDFGRSPAAAAVLLAPGATGVWDGPMQSLCSRPRQSGTTPAVLRYLEDEVVLLEGGEPLAMRRTTHLIRSLPPQTRNTAIYAVADMGVARSAGGVLAFARARRPSIFIPEPNHSLGACQLRQVVAAGLALPVAARGFVEAPDALIAASLGRTDELAEVQRHTEKLAVGVEREMAEHVADLLLRRPRRGLGE